MMKPLTVLQKYKARKTGLALGGGGALGLAHVGVLKALETYDIFPSVVSGNSAGALVGGLYVSGKSVPELIDLSEELGTNMLDKIRMPLKGGVIKSRRIHETLLDILGEKRIEDCDIPFYTATVDLNSGKSYYIHRGRMADAIFASICVPGVFQPFEANGLRLVDGGVRDTIPLRALKPHKLRLRIGVGILKASLNNEFPEYLDISPGKEGEEENASPGGILKVLSRSMSLMSTQSAFREINASKPDLAIYIDLGQKMRVWQFDRHETAIKTGYEQARKQLKVFFGK
ncbi:MAG: patatin-like phospholipase family protein [Candidatus Marinimicrobia bacterium]|nr:patatin-like phospholipase family protein [Candidatus Neomarinimicrobiota bacterium]